MLLRPTLTALAAVATLFLAGCSGSSGNTEPPPPPPVPTGKIDVSYGVAGKATTAGTNLTAGATVDSAGSVYGVGMFLFKLDPSGNPASYGDLLDYFESSPLLDAEGNLYTTSSNEISKRDANGHRVPTFGNAGLAMIPPLSNSPSPASGLARDNAGNLFTMGVFGNDPSIRLNIFKVNASGQWDAGFGVGGQRDIGVEIAGPSPWFAMALDSDGNVLVAGYLQSTLRLFVAKFDSHGNAVTDFGNGGIWQASQDCGVRATVTIAGLPSGDIVAGESCNGSSVIYKLDSKGAPVGAFSGGAAHLEASSVTKLLAGPNGSVYVAGGLGPGTGCHDLAVWKLGPDGRPIATFGNGGVVLPGLQAFGWSALALDGFGRLYVGASDNFCSIVGRPVPYVVYRMRG